MSVLIRALMRNGFRKGFLGGSRFWMIVLGVAGTIRLIQRINDREAQVVFSEKLQPGESLVIAHGREPR